MNDLILHFIKSHDEFYMFFKTFWIFSIILVPLIGFIVDESNNKFTLFICLIILLLLPASFLFWLYGGPQYSYE